MMLRLLQSIFGYGETNGAYPEAIVMKAIERAVDGTDPWLRAVPGYKKKLKPSVLRAIDYVVSLVDALPPPLALGTACYGEDPRLKAFFISPAEMRKILRSDRSMAGFLRGPDAGSPQVTALLYMERTETRTFGVELSGDAVVRDVPLVTVTFESHRLMDPAGNEAETRLRLKKRAFDYLVRVALQRITMAKSERKELERRGALLQAKLDMLRRGGWGFDGPGCAEGEDVNGLEERLQQVESQLLGLEVGDMLDSYLNIVIEVLGQPEQHLRGGQENLVLDRMGIRRDPATSNTVELALPTLRNAQGGTGVVLLVAVPGEELRGLT
jgi:hypothetical protein